MTSPFRWTADQEEDYAKVTTSSTSEQDASLASISVGTINRLPAFVVALLAVAVLLITSLALHFRRPVQFAATELEALSEVNVPEWVMDVVHQAGDANAAHRGNGLSDDPDRKLLARIFEGTHITGYPAGHPHGQFWILERLHEHTKRSTEVGPVKLSENAKLLRAGLRQAGFDFATFYHGSRNLFLNSILSGGFLYSRTDWLGPGIYFCSTFEHAQCYASEDGPIVEVEVYWHPKNQSRYIRHKVHHSLANDVYVVSDPLVIIPTFVSKCCPEKMTCM